MKRFTLICVSVVACACSAWAAGEESKPTAGAESSAQPKASTAALLYTATSLTPDEAASIGHALRSPEIYVSAHSPVMFSKADRLIRIGDRFGDVPALHALIGEGIYWNAGTTAVEFYFGEERLDRQSMLLQPGSLLIVGASHNAPPTKQRLSGGNTGEVSPDPLVPINVNGGCSVSCGSGYYACCNPEANGVVTCRCVNVIDILVCESGGVGSSACSMSN